MSDPLAGFEEMRARVRGQMEQARRRQEAVERLARELDGLTAHASSPRGEVTVTCRPDGAVTSVELSAAATALATAALGALVTETIGAAQRAAAEQAVSLTEERLDDAPEFAAQLRADLARRFAAPAPRNDPPEQDSYLSRFTRR